MNLPEAETESEVVGSEPLDGAPNTELALRMKPEIAKFDANAQEVRLGVATLGSLVIKDAASREHAYQMTKAASRSKTLIATQLKAVLAPYKIITDAIKAYADDELVAPLQAAIDAADAKMLAWDRIEKDRKAEEAKRLEAERLRIAEEAAAAQLKIEQAKTEGLAKVETSGEFAARQRNIDSMGPGILKIKAQRELDADRVAAKAAVETVAAHASQEARIDKGIALSDVRGKEEDLAVKTKGTAAPWKWELLDASLVPVNLKEVSDKLVNAAVKGGLRDIPGIRIYQEDRIRH